MRGLYARIATAFIAVASGVLLISTVVFVLETHYHFSLYEQQVQGMNNISSPTFDAHFEQAHIQSVLWSAVLGLVLAVILSLFVAKRITKPLIEMRNVAERMAKGELGARMQVKGNDEIADLGSSLNHLAKQLSHQEMLRKTMTADVAHELRTPLTTLKSHMEAMIEGIWETTPKRLESCHEEIERLRHLVGDLEQLTALESPQFQLDVQKEDLTSILTQSIEACRASFEQKGVRLLFTETPAFYGIVDRQRIGQILMNLLSNALKFTPAGGAVSVDLRQENGSLAISITDTGIGIPDEELPYVFERFYRADKSRDRKSGGSGIGLAIVKRLVEAHGGTIHMESTLGKGTTVKLLFPKI